MHILFNKSYLFYLALAICLLNTNKTHAQYILASQHGANDFYTYKDTAMQVNLSSNPSCTIDVNGDGVNDFTLTATLIQAGGYQDASCTISPLNNNQTIKDRTDTCTNWTKGLPMARAFNEFDTINHSFTWLNQTIYLAISEYQNMPYNYSCTDNFNQTDTSYIGVRVLSNSDTLYGWIRVKLLNAYGLTIIDYACQKKPLGINEIHSNNILSISPNPSTGVFTFHSPGIHQQSTIIIYNLLGEKLFSTEFSPLNSELSINLSDQARGVYFYRVIDINGKPTASGKLVVEKP